MKFSKYLALGLSLVMVSSFGACGSSNASNTSRKTELKMWAWDPTLKPVIKEFEKKNPNITIKMTNAGTSTDEYKALSNAVTAGSGAPDVAQFEYTAIPQHVLNGTLVDLSSKGVKKYQSFYTPGTWSSVNVDGGVYALPLDSGPLALFYNKAIFDKAGIPEPPKTWDEYYQDAKKIRNLGSNYYIAANSGDAGVFNSMLWQVGADPYKVKGKNVTINLAEDSKAKKYYDFEQKMINEGLTDTTTKTWSDDWYRGLSDGTIASLTIGAWMPTELSHGAGAASGDWRVALTPQWEEGENSNSENGGSSLGIIKNSKNEDAAYKFIDFASHNKEGIKLRVDDGAFPSDEATLNSSEFLNKTDKYFGDQQFNRILAQSAKNVTKRFQFLPYHVYALSIFPDTVGKAWSKQSTMQNAVEEWQKELVVYGKQQGFTVNQ